MNTLQTEIIETPAGGYGYRITCDERNVHILQTVKPGLPGNLPMTLEEVVIFAADKVAELEALHAAAEEGAAE